MISEEIKSRIDKIWDAFWSGGIFNPLEVIEMRDMVAVSILLAGFAPYLTDQINADIIYRE